MPSNQIKIIEILIQGKKGQTDQAIGQLETSGFVRPILYNNGNNDPFRVDKVVELIQVIAFQSELTKEDGSITRAITDEFSFYPENKPFTLEEYKQIIRKTVGIAKELRPDIHLLLATFPVVWPDGGIHNCGLYVQSPKSAEEAPIIHHFSKKNHSFIDFNYVTDDGSHYRLTTDKDCTADQLPDTLLKGSGIVTDDPNQFGSAIKLSPSVGESFILTIGVCLDHTLGVERDEAHGLIDKLNQTGEEVPLHCSHVITSASTSQTSANQLSTVSHADPDEFCRRPSKYPSRRDFHANMLRSQFTGILTLETFPAKHIGTLHSDLFQHVSAHQSPEQFAAYLNKQDIDGKTPLHHIFSETDFDSELIAKRIYSMTLNGADPDIRDNDGKSVRELALEADQAASTDGVISKALESALAWKEHMTTQNRIAANDNRTPLTRMLIGGKPNLERIKTLILSGANPYIKDGHGQSAIDIARAYSTRSTRILVEREIYQALNTSQYSYMINTNDPPSGQQEALDEATEDTIYVPIKNAIIFDVIMRSLTPMEQQIIYEDIKHQLPQLIKEIDDFVLISPYLNPEQKAILFDTKNTLLIESVKSARDCCYLLAALNLDQRSFVFENIRGRLPSLIRTVEDLNEVLKFLSQEQQSDLYRTFLPGIIHSAFDFHRMCVNAQPENRTIICERMEAELPQLIKTIDDFSLISRYLLPEQRAIIFNSVKEKLIDSIKTVSDCCYLLSLLSLDQRSVIFDNIKMRLPSLIRTVEDLNEVLKYLSQEQQSDLYRTFLPDIIHSAFDFYSVCENAQPENRTLMYERMVTKLPELIETIDDFCFISSALKSAQQSIIFNSVKEKLIESIKTVSDCCYLLSLLSLKQRSVVFDNIKMQLPNLIGTVQDLNEVLKYLSQEQQSDLYRTFLPDIIHSAFDFQEVLGSAQPENRKLIYECMKTKLPDLIKTIPEDLTDEQKYTITNQLTTGREITNAYKMALPKEGGKVQLGDEEPPVTAPPK